MSDIVSVEIIAGKIHLVFETLDQLITIENKPKKKIGFTAKEKHASYGKPKKM